MTRVCIYCGSEADTQDHVPPKCFFPNPKPSDLITVPSCAACNTRFGKFDEIVRNLFVSLHETEGHRSITAQLGDKRDRSLERLEGGGVRQSLLDSLRVGEAFSPSGILLGREPVLNLNQHAVDVFIERMTKALIYHRHGATCFSGRVRWRLAPQDDDVQSMPLPLQSLLSEIERVSVGDVFSFGGIFESCDDVSLWFMFFYRGLGVMSLWEPNRNDG